MPALAALSADGVEHLAHRLGVAVELLDARVDDLDGRRHVVGGVEHVEDRHVRALQQLALSTKASSTSTRGAMKRVGRDVAALGEEHVVQQRAVVGLGDLAGLLHRARGQADLVALERRGPRRASICTQAREIA